MVPVEEFEIFVLKMRDIFIRQNASVLNISIRYVPRDPGSLLAWAREDVFSFTIIYHQDKDAESLLHTEAWSQELIQAAIDSDGSFYLPFQIHETTEQFAKAYPDAGKLFELKQIADPGNRFRNMLWLEHYAGNMADKIAFEKAAQTPSAPDEDESQLAMQKDPEGTVSIDQGNGDETPAAAAVIESDSTPQAQVGPQQPSDSEN